MTNDELTANAPRQYWSAGLQTRLDYNASFNAPGQETALRFFRATRHLSFENYFFTRF
jgi:hypothetical protein